MKSFFASGSVRFILLMGLFLAFGGLILAVFWFMASPVGASFFAPPAPPQDYTWSYVEIAKPMKMAGITTNEAASLFQDPATPIPLEAVTPLPADTEAPGEITMEILENTPVPDRATSEYAPVSPSYNGSKYILVDISEQHMYVYDGDTLVYSFVASTGINNATRIGHFAVQSKIPNAYGSTWNIWMPNWLGIYWSGSLENGIHALPILSNGATLWEGFLGRPVSYGCVVLGTYESSLLYDWAEIGTPVEIQW